MKLRYLLIFLFAGIFSSAVLADPPVASCHQEAVTSIFDGQESTIHAWQFNRDSYDNETNRNDLRFAFSEDVSDNTISLDCDSNSEISVTLFVFDDDDEFSTCDATLHVDKRCSESPIINGSADQTAPIPFLTYGIELVNLDSISFSFIVPKDFNLSSYDNNSEANNLDYSFSEDFTEDVFYYHCDDGTDLETTIYLKDEEDNISWVDVAFFNSDIGCDNAFQQDDEAPDAGCVNATFNIESGGVATVEASAVAADTEDNITPFPRLTFTFDESDLDANTLEYSCSDLGEHELEVFIFDHEGNMSSCMATITVEDPDDICSGGDAEAPNASCAAFAAELEETNGGTVDVLASSFDDGSTDNITASDDLRFSFSDSDVDDNTRSYECGDLGDEISLEVFVWDEAGNVASCDATLIVIDPENYCNDEESPDAVCADYNATFTSDEPITVNASDFDGGSSDNNTHNSYLKFSFSSDPTDSSVDFPCDSIGITRDLTIWVTDLAGNQSSCEASLEVSDPNNECLVSTDFSALKDLRIYPNPFNDQVTLENLPTERGELLLVVVDMKGQPVYREKTDQSNVRISTDLASGVYQLQVFDKMNSLLGVKKLVKE